MRKTKLALIISTGILLLAFIVTLFNPFRNEDTRYYNVLNYYDIKIEEKENRYDEEYLLIQIDNISGEDVFNTAIVFGHKENSSVLDNFIWFRSAKIKKNDTITIKFYEETGERTVYSKLEGNNFANYDVSYSSESTEFDIERCMYVESVGIDSEEPKVVKAYPSYWSIEKTIFAVLSGVSAIALGVVFYLDYKKEGDKNDEKTA